MDNMERIAVLESRLDTLDGVILEIRDEQSAARTRDTERQVDMGKLTTQLGALITALSDHQQWHRDNTGSKFSLSNIVVSVCALLVLVADLLLKFKPI